VPVNFEKMSPRKRRKEQFNCCAVGIARDKLFNKSPMIFPNQSKDYVQERRISPESEDMAVPLCLLVHQPYG
jgi:hypothetical protein